MTTTLAIVYALVATPIYTAKTTLAQAQVQALLTSQTVQDGMVEQFILIKITLPRDDGKRES